jgi:hypothetical protein
LWLLSHSSCLFYLVISNGLTSAASPCFLGPASRARADALANLLLPSKVAPRKRDVVGVPATKRDLLTT